MSFAAALTGCGADSADEPAAADCGVSEFGTAAEFVGLRIEEAERRAREAGLETRVMGRDGTCAWEREGDRSDGRVTFYVTSGEVTSAARY